MPGHPFLCYLLPRSSALSFFFYPLFWTFTQIATSANVVNCSSAPNCTSLNREHCFKTHGTCSNCFEGYSGNLFLKVATQLFYLDFLMLFLTNYVGISGDSNVICRNTSSAAAPIGDIGSTCRISSDCLYGQCTGNVCTAPILECPTSVFGKSKGNCGMRKIEIQTRPKQSVSCLATQRSALFSLFSSFQGLIARGMVNAFTWIPLGTVFRLALF